MKAFFRKVFELFFVKKEVEHSEKYNKTINFLNKYSLVFHGIIALFLVFVVELISRRSLMSALSFMGTHTLAYIYNSFLVFSSLLFVYLFKRRAFSRVIISGFWTVLGIINGCVLSNRVTPFGYTDLKCIPELLAMNNTNYFTAQQATIVVVGLTTFILFCIILFIKGPKYQGKIHFVVMPIAICATLFVGIPLTTSAAQRTNVVASYFANIAQGYSDYGFVYSFSSSVVDRGMSKPEDYSEERISEIKSDISNSVEKTTVDGKTGPNVICVLLESFCDPDEINFLKVDKDPIPTFHKLEKEYTSGYLTVPVVGAGTANTEFEVLTGMSMQHFGTGEYPYKTILKQTDCESIASDLSKIGYGTHVVHNNGGNFYSRTNAFSMFGFDTFTSKELMGVKEWTPNGSWSSDDILVPETIKSLDATPDQADFTYTITVSTHGDYPKEAVIENPRFNVSGCEDEATKNQWTYYVNQLNACDRFIDNLIKELSQRDEDTIVVMFGDHLPTMGLEDSDMKSESIYKTKYITWNNFGLEKKDADLYAYQLLAYATDVAGIHEGTMFTYHQTQEAILPEAGYLDGIKNLQYDLLYGKRYFYEGEDPYPASDLVMGIDEVTIEDAYLSYDKEHLIVRGSNFTNWSSVYINGTKVQTEYINNAMLQIDLSEISDGDTIVVNQLGSSNTIFRSSNEFVYQDPNSTETETPSESETSSETETSSDK